MQLNEFDASVLLAKSPNDLFRMYAVRYGKIWKFYYQDTLEPSGSGTIGSAYDSKSLLLKNAYDFIINRSGYGFYFVNNLESCVKEYYPVYITKNHLDAIDEAIEKLSLLSNTSDIIEYLSEIKG